MKPVAVHHVSVNVADVTESVAFYTEVLGGSVRSDRPDDLGFGGAWLDFGGQQVHLIEGEAPPNVGQHFALLVDSLDDAIHALRAKGVSVGDPSPIGTSRQAFLPDPSGNLIELHEVARTG